MRWAGSHLLAGRFHLSLDALCHLQRSESWPLGNIDAHDSDFSSPGSPEPPYPPRCARIRLRELLGRLARRAHTYYRRRTRAYATSPEDASAAVARAHKAVESWRNRPAPKRGEFVRLLGEELRASLAPLGRLVTIETGKIVAEGLGEVQEMIDICGFASGLSRQRGGPTLPSEWPAHRMMETWHPLGVVGAISAFNFPAAVWSWNAALALVCGNAVVWKPSEKTPLTALATQAIFERAARKYGGVPAGLCALLVGGLELGDQLDRRRGCGSRYREGVTLTLPITINELDTVNFCPIPSLRGVDRQP